MADPLDTDLLRKIWNMMERGTPGEQVAARARAEHMLVSHGYVLEDVAWLLGEAEQKDQRDAEHAWAVLSDWQQRILEFMGAFSAQARIQNGKSIVDLVDEHGAPLVPGACTRRTIEILLTKRLIDQITPLTFAINHEGRRILFHMYASVQTRQN